MSQDSRDTRELYRALAGRGGLPLDPDSPYYVPILEPSQEKDPILRLARRIEFAESESVDLLTGFRGNGKSTQLRRLKKLLEEQGCQVFLVDMLEFVLMTKPIELTDFLLSLMAALSSRAQEDTDLEPVSRSYWERLQGFLKSEVVLEKLDIEAAPGMNLGLKLKTDAVFKEQVQKRLRGKVTGLVEDARLFVSDLVDRLRQEDPNKKVVLLVDSVEQLRGVGQEAHRVHESALELFAGEAANLAFPKLHVVYTIPPYLIPLAQNLGRSLGGHPITVWPNIHVRDKQGRPDSRGLEVVERVIEHRHEGWKRVLSKEQLDRLGGAFGGDLRDLFRMVREVCLTLDLVRERDPGAQVDDRMLTDVEQQLQNELLPGSEEDYQWLAEIHRTKMPALPSTKELPALARFLDGNLIMNYANGEPWYDVHPLLVAALEKRAETAG